MNIKGRFCHVNVTMEVYASILMEMGMLELLKLKVILLYNYYVNYLILIVLLEFLFQTKKAKKKNKKNNKKITKINEN